MAQCKEDDRARRLTLLGADMKTSQLRQVQEVTEASLTSMRQKYDDAVKQAANAEAAAAEKTQELEEVRADAQAKTAALDELRARVTDAERERDELRSRVEELSSSNVELRAASDRAASERNGAESRLQQRLDAALRELEDIRAAREQMAASLHDVTTKNVTASMEATAMREQLQRLETELDAARRSKTMLQHTLVAQLGQVRDELAHQKRRGADGTPAYTPARSTTAGAGASAGGGVGVGAGAGGSAASRSASSATGALHRQKLMPPPSPPSPPSPPFHTSPGRSTTPSVSMALQAAKRASQDAVDAVRDSEAAEADFQRMYSSLRSHDGSAGAGTSATWRNTTPQMASPSRRSKPTPGQQPRAVAITAEQAQAAALHEIEARVAAAEAAMSRSSRRTGGRAGDTGRWVP